MATFTNFNVYVHRVGASDHWKLSVHADCVPTHHERTQRDYCSASDALTSSRHLINELVAGRSLKTPVRRSLGKGGKKRKQTHDPKH